jgi:hypothetical protein
LEKIADKTMYMTLHTFYTWLLANLLVPVIYILTDMVVFGSAWFGPGPDNVFIDYFYLFIISVLFSLPCLVFCRIALKFIVFSSYINQARLVLWLTTTAVLVFLEELALIWLFSWEFSFELLSIMIPPVIATVLAVLIRYRQFYNLIYSFQAIEPETDLVQKAELDSETTFE